MWSNTFSIFTHFFSKFSSNSFVKCKEAVGDAALQGVFAKMV
jgi:hypothetical protein